MPVGYPRAELPINSPSCRTLADGAVGPRNDVLRKRLTPSKQEKPGKMTPKLSSAQGEKLKPITDSTLCL